MGGNKVIRDPVHGYISVRAEDLPLLDHPLMQRLRRIGQTGAGVVYPGATHTRFEHSLGVMHLSQRIFDGLVQRESFGRATKELGNTIRYAALLHDIGHPPLSHVGERLMKRADLVTELAAATKEAGLSFTPPSEAPKHELASCIIALRHLRRELDKLDVDLDLFCRAIVGQTDGCPADKACAVEILNSSIDSDKLDYVLRDAFATGADLVSLDAERMLAAYCAQDGRLAVDSRALSAIVGLVRGRSNLYTWVYNHHAVVFRDAALERYLNYLGVDTPEVHDLFSTDGLANRLCDDGDVWHLLRSSASRDGICSDFFGQLSSRRYLKAVWKTPLEFVKVFEDTPVLMDKFIMRVKESQTKERLESWISAIASSVELQPTDICIANAKVTPNWQEAYIRTRHPATDQATLKRFTELFPMPSFLRPYQFDQLPFLYTNPDYRDRVLTSLKESLGGRR